MGILWGYGARDQGGWTWVAPLAAGVIWTASINTQEIDRTPEVFRVQAGYAFRALVQGADGFRLTVQAGDGFSGSTEGGG